MSTQGEVAAHIFCSPQWVRHLIDASVITRCPPGGYDIDICRKEVLGHLRNVAAARGSSTRLADERAALARAQRELAEMKTGQLRGRLVEIERVADALENRYALCKERLLSIPGKCGDELARRDRGDVIGVLRREIYEALDELSTPARLVEEAGGGPAGDGKAERPT
jgi:phage terminase Nu1 subunit (DNA packaging protein)